MADEKNAMEELARAAFYVTDAMRGVLGEWEIEDSDWSPATSRTAYEELQRNLKLLKEAGWKDRPKLSERAPYSQNIRVGCFYKTVRGVGKRWITLTVASRFGLIAKFKVHKDKPWQD